MPTHILVFLPGILGSQLELNGKVVWPGPVTSLHGPYPNLADLLDDRVVATDVLRKVCIANQYNTLISLLGGFGFPEAAPGASGNRLVLCPYDWRKSNIISAGVLKDVLNRIVAATPDAQITLIGHSMGGLVIRYYLESGNFTGEAGFGHVTNAVFIATPSSGAAVALQSILGQSDTVFVTRDQARQLVADPRYPSTYELLPPRGTPFLWNSPQGQLPEMVDLFSDAVIGELGLSKTSLDSNNRLYAGIAVNRKPAGVKYFTFVGTHFATATVCTLTGSTVAGVEPADAGDGTVPIWSSQIAGVPQIQVDGEHSVIYQNGTVTQYLTTFLRASTGMALAVEAAAPPAQPQLNVRNHILGNGKPIHVSLSIPQPMTTSSSSALAAAALQAMPALDGEVRLEPLLLNDAGVVVGLGDAVLRLPVDPGQGATRVSLVIPSPVMPGPYRVGYYSSRSPSGVPVAYDFLSVAPAAPTVGMTAKASAKPAAPRPTVPLSPALAALLPVLQAVRSIPFLEPRFSAAINAFVAAAATAGSPSVFPSAVPLGAMDMDSINARIDQAITDWTTRKSTPITPDAPGSMIATPALRQAFANLKPVLDYAMGFAPARWRLAIELAETAFEMSLVQPPAVAGPLSVARASAMAMSARPGGPRAGKSYHDRFLLIRRKAPTVASPGAKAMALAAPAGPAPSATMETVLNELPEKGKVVRRRSFRARRRVVSSEARATAFATMAAAASDAPEYEIVEAGSREDAQTLQNELAKDPSISVKPMPLRWLFAEAPAAGSAVPPDRLWNHIAIQRAQAKARYDFNQAQGVTVALLDTGVDATHPNLVLAVDPNQYAQDNPVGPGQLASTNDVVGHGTHVAGIIAAELLSQSDAEGVCPGKIRCWKIFTDTPLQISSTQYAYVVDPILYHSALTACLDQQIKVINLSIGGPAEPDDQELQLFQDLLANGTIICAAMGNEGGSGSPTSYPAAIPGVIAVGATDENDNLPWFSSVGNHIALSAPGTNILSTLPTYAGGEGFGVNFGSDGSVQPGAIIPREMNYGQLSGTSMATPLVSAAVALLCSKFPGITPAQAKMCLQATATKVPQMGGQTFTPDFGAGRLNLHWLLALAAVPPPTDPAVAPE